MDFFERFVHRDFIEREYEFSELYRYLDKYKSTELFERANIKRNASVKLNHTIWLFWGQGMENAPKLVQICYESVCKNKPQDYAVILLTDKNLNKYINLPDYIWEKYEKKYITITHLSDIIRLELLGVYGGCWIDATVFLSGIIPKYMLSGDMFMFKLPSVMSDPVLKLSSWWISSVQSNRLIRLTRQILCEYWKYETDLRNYFLLHTIMSKLIDEDSDCGNIFYNIPYFNSGNAHVLQGKLGEVYKEEEWQIIKNISCVHKLTYKHKYLQGDIYNYYTALLRGGL